MRREWFFGFFFVSGFCSLVYQVVWLRLAMAAFGVTTPMISIVLSIFMAGLAAGSWGAGRLARRSFASPAAGLRFYALAEMLIAVSGDSVPAGLTLARALLSGAGTQLTWGSAAHYLSSGLGVAVVMLPFCICMGATFPLAMWAIRQNVAAESARSFSYLYFANVMGAALGTLTSAFVLIELLGFRGTALLAAGLNALLAAIALILSLAAARNPARLPAPEPAGDGPAVDVSAAIPWVLFGTGLASMGLEVIWVRQFTPYLGTVVYSFAVVLALYLGATSTGSCGYRWLARRGDQDRAAGALWPLLGAAGLLSLLASDPRLPLPHSFGSGAVRALFGITPLCGALGFLTPLLLDRWSGGRADRAGGAYALNVVGGILGPLVAGFALLPHLGERGSTVALAVPLFACGLAGASVVRRATRSPTLWMAAAAASLLVALATRDFAARFPRREVRIDHAATVIATGEGMDRFLLVNGIGMTRLTPITKMMVHLPLAFLDVPPRRGLVVCFGMGTSFRSMLSWEIESTAVELIPSVPELFGYFHADGPERMRSSRGRVAVDDGRRFLERTHVEYDVISVDPPPPVEAAGSSLLYSREFYALARKRLRPGGILQQWLPYGDGVVVASFTRALLESFAYLRAFPSLEGGGIHYLASDRPIPATDVAGLVRRLPSRAAEDLIEWGPATTAAEQLRLVVDRELPPEALLRLAPGVPALTDDRPFNEYYLLRRMRAERAGDLTGVPLGP